MTITTQAEAEAAMWEIAPYMFRAPKLGTAEWTRVSELIRAVQAWSETQPMPEDRRAVHQANWARLKAVLDGPS